MIDCHGVMFAYISGIVNRNSNTNDDDDDN